MSQNPANRENPLNWDKWVSAAYLRMLGNTQDATAKGVGVALRTVQRWESETENWQRARTEARSRWLSDAEDAARMAVLGSLRLGNADLGKWLLERVDTALAPAKQRLDVRRVDRLHDLSDDELADIAAGKIPE